MGKKKKSLKKQAKLAAKWESDCGGKSILEMYWDELDGLMLVLMDPDEDLASVEMRKGRAEGVAWCIAVLVNPYHPDINTIRAQAVDRYNDRIEDINQENAIAGEPEIADPGGPHKTGGSLGSDPGSPPQQADEM